LRGGVAPLSLALAVLAPCAALAQTAPAAAPAADGPAPGDIVVTAQKRSERLQDVPLAVTAVGGDMLAKRQINDTSSLVAAVPSLTFQQGANPTNTVFRIRGIGTALFGQGVESSVSTVVDGVVAVRAAQGFSDLSDVERIEVLRGPQGTLFGKNATAASSASPPPAPPASWKPASTPPSPSMTNIASRAPSRARSATRCAPASRAFTTM
jgi:iron complex outermembrane receptor protein